MKNVQIVFNIQVPDHVSEQEVSTRLPFIQRELKVGVGWKTDNDFVSMPLTPLVTMPSSGFQGKADPWYTCS